MERSLSTIPEELDCLAASAEVDDVSFPMVINALNRLDALPPGRDDTDRMLHFVGLMLDQGFVAVTSPYDAPPSAPWCGGDRDAVLKRLRQEWEALDHDPTFLDLCWFHRP